jgi:hypothetical protein
MRSKLSAHSSKASCGTGPSHGRRARRANCATRRCSRSSPRIGRPVKNIFRGD